MRLALDTNRYADLCRGTARVVETVASADEVWLPFIVVGGLRAGFGVGTQGPHNEYDRDAHFDALPQLTRL